jgi:hypothetical protein
MQFQVYKYWGFSHDYIGDEIIDESFILSIKSGFKNPKWKPMIDAWFRKFDISIYLDIFIILIWLVY